MSRTLTRIGIAALVAICIFATPPPAGAQTPDVIPTCANTITADVVALDQVFYWNRLGAVQPQGMMYALKHEVFPGSGGPSSYVEQVANSCAYNNCTAGNVHLRNDKRPRPLVLRMNVGDCLRINFTNLLDPTRRDMEQVKTRDASIHAIGMQLVGNISSDGSNVGLNSSSLVPTGGSRVYTLYAEREGQHVISSAGAMTGGEADGGQQPAGLFGAINVEPKGSVWYRSQVTESDLQLASIPQPQTWPPSPQHPRLDFTRRYVSPHPKAGLPIFEMLDNNRVVHSDLTAIIAGPFTDGYPENVTYPDRDQSFREITIMYHDEPGAVQAFPRFFDDRVLSHTLHSVRDAFAINYGTGGIGAEIIANRLGLGPMLDCTECKYEEFFLSSWVVGDPAMVVDRPANVSDPQNGVRATKALYPDDPSNVYHSYLADHVKFRVLHTGAKEHHIHHQHAHQWLYAPDSDKSTYLDSQAVGPGNSFTLEMAYHGSGNKNLTAGDSIFHCHFYPHFAQGMWAMWRVHDVFEDGSRMLPDGEIADGSPIPAVVPIPGMAMAPLPGATVTIAQDPTLPNLGGQVQINGTFVRNMPPGMAVDNPGYPFWVPGVAGHRPPHPPLDTIHDGGLRRHVITGGEAKSVETRLDFTKELRVADAFELAETGVPVEESAMKFHNQRTHTTVTPSGTTANFLTNGAAPVMGAPFADPCVDIDGRPAGGNTLDENGSVIPPRTYKAANIQLDVVFNKEGWHFPQQRIITLWEDVDPTYNGDRPPEPFFFRAKSDECIEYWHTNLVPGYYELDDFQVRTPTDILGQHIHLVKFDVLSSDGSGNGWNYEDGTFSPDETRERIHAIRVFNNCTNNDWRNGTFECPVALPHPSTAFQQRPEFLGAQTTVQRWYADPVLDNQLNDRTLRTVFTHDHYGPSTHQQAGLYAGLVVEPKDSTWRDPETGVILGTRDDGGPTSWRADILTGLDHSESYREFLLEFADFQLAYQVDSHPNLPNGFARGPTFPNEWACHNVATGAFCAGQQPGNGNGVGVGGLGIDNNPKSINPPGKEEAGLPDLLQRPDVCPTLERSDRQDTVWWVGPAPAGVQPLDIPPPCPEAISADDVGTMVVNYRNEPVALRVANGTQQATGDAGDLALAFSSKTTRANANLNSQPGWYNNPLSPQMKPKDPYTPLMQAFDSDRVQIQTLVGAHEEGHNFSVNGIKWLFEPSWSDSGYRNGQMMGISEHFEMVVPQLVKNSRGAKLDYLYTAGAATDDLWNGIWGLIRTWRADSAAILKLPNNPNGDKPIGPGQVGNFRGVCPVNAPVAPFELIASTAQQLLGGPLEYNSRPGPNSWGPITDPGAIMYVHASDVTNGKLNAGVPIEPLVLRANAGDCIEVALINNLPATTPLIDDPGFNTLPMIIDGFNNNDISPSKKVGLHPQMVFYDASRSDGNNVGFNPVQTADPNKTVKYQWYAGDILVNDNGTVQVTPIEFGATNLMPADRMKQPSKGAIGALIIEPEGATWIVDSDVPGCLPMQTPAADLSVYQPRCSRASATVYPPGATPPFREFVLLFQDDLNLRCNNCGNADDGDVNAIPNLADSDDPEDSGQKALNYRTEPMWFRYGYAPDASLGFTRELNLKNILSNTQIGGVDPETPVFLAPARTAVRFRVLEPGGHARNHVFQLHGHVWEQEPYFKDSTVIGTNPDSMWEGAKMGHGPGNHFDALLKGGAGGSFGVRGDYLFRDHSSFLFDGGLWGLMRVGPWLMPVPDEYPIPLPDPSDPIPYP